jgi:peptide chain release factor 1
MLLLFASPTSQPVWWLPARMNDHNYKIVCAPLASCARLFEIEEQKRQTEREEARRSQVGTGERSEKIRTYNFPQSRVTDHRINVSSYNLPSVMNGEIDLFIDELSIRDETDRLSYTGSDEDED